jgi:uncharacterized protein (TIGR00725 family)
VPTPAAKSIVSVFGSSRVRPGSPAYDEAWELGQELAGRGITVCSGGYGGVMEAVSRGAREAGGATIGVTSRVFRARANAWIAEEVRVASWQDRLFELMRRAQGYVVCRGGTGTLVELAVAWEMLNKGLMRGKPLAVLGPFWLPVIDRVNEAETGRSTRGPTLGDRVVYRAASPGDAARFLADRLRCAPRARHPAPSGE